MRLQGGTCGVAAAPHRPLEQKYKHRLGTCSLETQAIRPSPDLLNREVWGSGPSRQCFWFTIDLQDCGSSTVQYHSTLQNDQRAKSSYCLPPYRAVRALLTAFSTLYILSPRLVYFKPRLYPLAFITYFIHRLPPSPLAATFGFCCDCLCFITVAHSLCFHALHLSGICSICLSLTSHSAERRLGPPTLWRRRGAILHGWVTFLSVCTCTHVCARVAGTEQCHPPGEPRDGSGLERYSGVIYTYRVSEAWELEVMGGGQGRGWGWMQRVKSKGKHSLQWVSL